MGRKVQFKGVSYHGGHPDYDRTTLATMLLIVDDVGVHLRGVTEKFVIPWHEVTGVSIEGPDTAERRVTLTRVATIGVFAWGAKKTMSDAYVAVHTDRYVVGFQVPKTSAGEVRVKLGPWTTQLQQRDEHAQALAHEQHQPEPAARQGPPAGWYNDPDGAELQRWWGGYAWTEHTTAQAQ